MSQPHLSKLARQFIIELRALDKPAPINRIRYATIKSLYLAAGLDGDDSRAVDRALDSAWQRVGFKDSGQHDCWG